MKTLRIKTIILIAAIGLISYHTMAQKTNDVPQAVLTAFSVKYPQARLKKWKTDKANYVAYFVLNNKKYQATYSATGYWLITERDIRHENSLPADVQSFLKNSKYASWHIDDMKRVRTPQQNTYQIALDNHSGSPFRYNDAASADDQVLYFDDGGKLIKATEN